MASPAGTLFRVPALRTTTGGLHAPVRQSRVGEPGTMHTVRKWVQGTSLHFSAGAPGTRPWIGVAGGTWPRVKRAVPEARAVHAALLVPPRASVPRPRCRLTRSVRTDAEGGCSLSAQLSLSAA